MSTIIEMLNFTAENDVSDLHISSGLPPMVRMSGSMEALDSPPLSGEEVNEMIKTLCNEEQWEKFQKIGMPIFPIN